VIRSSELGRLAAAMGPAAHRNESLAHYTAMSVGGPADLLLVARSTSEVVRAVEQARRCDVHWRVLGCGCNVLVSDAGLRGLVIVQNASTVETAGTVVTADAGAPLMVVARDSVRSGLAGLEWASGLPGSVGGAVTGNAGAFGGDIAGVMTTAQMLEAEGGIVERACDWFEFDYRSSRIKMGNGGEAILSVEFGLQEGDRAGLQARAEEILDYRRKRHPTGATMGSTFVNPPGRSAGTLIEQAGLKGHRVGNAHVSEIHANFLLNDGGATAAEVAALIDHIRNVVVQEFGIELELEIELLGEFPSLEK